MSMDGISPENYREIAKGLFGEEVDIENLTEEQKAQIEAVHRGSEEGFELGLREFFEEQRASEKSYVPPSADFLSAETGDQEELGGFSLRTAIKHHLVDALERTAPLVKSRLLEFALGLILNTNDLPQLTLVLVQKLKLEDHLVEAIISRNWVNGQAPTGLLVFDPQEVKQAELKYDCLTPDQLRRRLHSAKCSSLTAIIDSDGELAFVKSVEHLDVHPTAAFEVTVSTKEGKYRLVLADFGGITGCQAATSQNKEQLKLRSVDELSENSEVLLRTLKLVLTDVDEVYKRLPNKASETMHLPDGLRYAHSTASLWFIANLAVSLFPDSSEPFCEVVVPYQPLQSSCSSDREIKVIASSQRLPWEPLSYRTVLLRDCQLLSGFPLNMKFPLVVDKIDENTKHRISYWRDEQVESAIAIPAVTSSGEISELIMYIGFGTQHEVNPTEAQLLSVLANCASEQALRSDATIRTVNWSIAINSTSPKRLKLDSKDQLTRNLGELLKRLGSNYSEEDRLLFFLFQAVPIRELIDHNADAEWIEGQAFKEVHYLISDIPLLGCQNAGEVFAWKIESVPGFIAGASRLIPERFVNSVRTELRHKFSSKHIARTSSGEELARLLVWVLDYQPSSLNVETVATDCLEFLHKLPYIEQAHELESEQGKINFAEAVSQLELAAESDNGDYSSVRCKAYIYRKLAYLKLLSSHYKVAREYARLAVDLAPSVKNRCLKGDTALAAGNILAAWKSYHSAQRVFPKLSMPHFHIGDMWLILAGLVRTEHPELAKKLLSHARRSFLSALNLEHDPNYKALYRLRLADVYKQLGDTGMTLNEITLACSLLSTPRSVFMEPIAHVVRALAEQNIPRRRGFFKDLTKLLNEVEPLNRLPVYFTDPEKFFDEGGLENLVTNYLASGGAYVPQLHLDLQQHLTTKEE